MTLQTAKRLCKELLGRLPHVGTEVCVKLETVMATCTLPGSHPDVLFPHKQRTWLANNAGEFVVWES